MMVHTVMDKRNLKGNYDYKLAKTYLKLGRSR